MNRSVTRPVLLSLTILALTSGSVSASDSRIAAMGGNAYIVSDYWNIWLFPAEITDHGSAAVAGWGRESFSSPEQAIMRPRDFAPISGGKYGGTFFGIDEMLGLNRFGAGLFIDGSDEILSFYPEPADQKLDLFLGGASGSFRYGFHFGRAATSEKAIETIETTEPKTAIPDAEESSLSRNAFDFGGGYRVNEKVDLEGTISFFRTSFDNLPGESDDTGDLDDGYNLFSFRARSTIAVNDRADIIPYFEFVNDNRGQETIDGGVTTRTDRRDIRQISVGAGVNYRPERNEKILLVAGVEITHQTIEIEMQFGDGEPTTFEDKFRDTPAVSMGLEYELARWFTLRAGVQKRITNEEVTSGIAKEKTTTTFAFNVGGGLHAGDFALDIVIDPDYLFDGPNILTGEESDLVVMATGTLVY